VARAGADFIGVSDEVWRHPDGAAAGVRAMREVIAGA
jgi:thiamine-phosphate pyrophosphorylase